MASTDIVARLRLAGEQFTTELHKRMSEAEKAATSTASRINQAFGTVKGIAVTGALGFGAGEVAAVASRALDYASSLGEVSQQLGVTTRDLQVYRYAATQAGIDQEVMDKSLAKLTLTIGKAAGGSKPAAAAFASLGIGVRAADGHIRTAGEAIPLIADALAKVEDPARRAAAEVALFGKGGQALDTLLSAGRQQIDGFAAAAEHFGIVLTEAQIERADAAADAAGKLKTVLEANIAGVVADNAGAILHMAGALESLTSAAIGARGVFSEVSRNSREREVKRALQNSFGSLGYRPLTEYDDAHTARIKGSVTVGGGPLLSADAVRLGKRNADTTARIAAEERQAAAIGRTSAAAGRASAAHRATSRATSDAAAAARDLAAAQRELAATFDDLDRRFDPTRRLMQDYASTLDGLDKERKAGRIDARTDVSRQLEASGDLRNALGEQTAAKAIEDLRRAGVDFDAVTDRARSELSDFIDRTPITFGAALGNAVDDAGKRFERSGVQAAQAIGQVLGVKASSALGKVLGGVTGAATGNFAGLDSPAGGVLTLLSGASGTGKGSSFQKGMAEVLDPLKASFDKLGGKLGLGGDLGVTLGKASANAGIGSTTGQLVGLTGLKGSATGGALGGVIGGATPLGPLGAAIGGAVGSAVLGAFKSVKKGSATIGFVGDALGVTSLTGNSATFKAAASGAAASVIDSLKRIADTLGGDLNGNISTSIGVRHGDYRVDTSGRGVTKIKNGAVDFNDDSQAAIRFAIADALKDGVITAISDASKRIFASGQDLEAALDKANFIESIPKQLKAITDPLGAAIDELDGKWRKQVAILKEAGASVNQITDAQKLYKLQLDQVNASVGGAAESLRTFKSSLSLGGSSPLSLRDQRAAAEAAFRPFVDKIGAGQSIDQEKFAAAAQSVLDIDRQLYGSTEAYFATFDRVQALTTKAIAAIDNAQPIRGVTTDPFAEITAKAVQASAEIASDQVSLLQQQNQLLADNNRLLQQALAGRGGFVGSTYGRMAS